MILRSLHILSIATASLLASVLPSPALAVQEQTVRAFTVFEGRGTIYQTGSNSALFVGGLRGQFFIETSEAAMTPSTVSLTAPSGDWAG